MAKYGGNEPRGCRQAHLFLSCKITIRSEIALSEKELPPLLMRGPYEQQWPSFCLHPLHPYSSWARSSERNLPFFFSAISRKAWRPPWRQDGETSLRALPDSTIQPRVREFQTRTPPQPLRPRSLTGMTGRSGVIKSV